MYQDHNARTREDLSILYDVPFIVEAEMGATTRTVKEVLGIGEGSVIELDNEAGSLVALNINGKTIARGEIIEVDGYYGVRVVEVLS